jgi:transposase
LSAEKLTLEEIAVRVGVTRKIVSMWRKRFFEMGINGLKDMSGRGRPKTYGAEERVDILALACTKPPDGSTRWSVRKLAKATGKSKTFVNGLLNAAKLKPHKTTYWCGKSQGPKFKEKRANVIGLYLSPPENALVLCVDEKSQICRAATRLL